MMQDESGEGAQRAGLLPDAQQAALDWITIWQSELQALAGDREARESCLRWTHAWAEAARAEAAFLSAAHDANSPRPAVPPGPKTAMAPSDPGGDALHRLAERVAELERKLAGRQDPT